MTCPDCAHAAERVALMERQTSALRRALEGADTIPAAGRYARSGLALGQLVDRKQTEYGDSASRSGQMLAVLYPAGVPVHAYGDSLLIVRVLDKLSRIAQRGADGVDLGRESPWQDIAGYGLLGAAQDEP